MSYLLPIHLMTYGYTFGSTTFHSFVASFKAIETLPRREFGEFQGKVLPIQFVTQSVAQIIIGLTAPYTISTLGLGLLGVSALGGIANIAYLTPKCAHFKTKRWEIVDTKYNGDNEAAVKSGEVSALDKQFGKFHGMSMGANLLSIVALTAYGFILSGHLKVI